MTLYSTKTLNAEVSLNEIESFEAIKTPFITDCPSFSYFLDQIIVRLFLVMQTIQFFFHWY